MQKDLISVLPYGMLSMCRDNKQRERIKSLVQMQKDLISVLPYGMLSMCRDNKQSAERLHLHLRVSRADLSGYICHLQILC